MTFIIYPVKGSKCWHLKRDFADSSRFALGRPLDHLPVSRAGSSPRHSSASVLTTGEATQLLTLGFPHSGEALLKVNMWLLVSKTFLCVTPAQGTCVSTDDRNATSSRLLWKPGIPFFPLCLRCLARAPITLLAQWLSNSQNQT